MGSHRAAHARSTLVDIATAVGFANHSHFTTVFKNRIGISPGAYQKHNRMVAVVVAAPGVVLVAQQDMTGHRHFEELAC